MKKYSNILWGAVLILIGVLWTLNSLEILPFELFFEGWWTLFIIVPAIIGLISGGDRWWNIIALIIGVILLLWVRGIVDISMVLKLIIPAIIVFAGFKMILGDTFGKKRAQVAADAASRGEKPIHGTGIFSEQTLNYNGETFSGAELNAVFGAVKCDLRGAVIEHDCVINASAIFGGITVYVPENVKLKVNSNSLFGGVSNKARYVHDGDCPTLYISGSCMFGGVDIK